MAVGHIQFVAREWLSREGKIRHAKRTLPAVPRLKGGRHESGPMFLELPGGGNEMKTRSPAQGGASRDGSLGKTANSDADYTAIEAALSYIPANDRDTWLRMGMAVKPELGEDGFVL
jgi:hypothetical protein